MPNRSRHAPTPPNAGRRASCSGDEVEPLEPQSTDTPPGPPLGVAAAARLVPGLGTGGTASRCTIVRWLVRGVVVRGERVRLAGRKCGGRWFTDRASLEAFLTATSTAAGVDLAPARTPGERRRDSERAAARLAAAGW